jgi:hypothetical protein
MNRKESNVDNQTPTADIGQPQTEMRNLHADLNTMREPANEDLRPLFSNDSIEAFRSRWGSIQTGFVDEPRKSVNEADKLVAEVMKKMAVMFTEERDKLEKQWDGGDNVSTEDLRLALQRYRLFFNRLLAM